MPEHDEHRIWGDNPPPPALLAAGYTLAIAAIATAALVLLPVLALLKRKH